MSASAIGENLVDKGTELYTQYQVTYVPSMFYYGYSTSKQIKQNRVFFFCASTLGSHNCSEIFPFLNSWMISNEQIQQKPPKQ